MGRFSIVDTCNKMAFLAEISFKSGEINFKKSKIAKWKISWKARNQLEGEKLVQNGKIPNPGIKLDFQSLNLVDFFYKNGFLRLNLIDNLKMFKL